MASSTAAPRKPLGEVATNSIAAAPTKLSSEKAVRPSKKRKADNEKPQYHIDDDICQTVDISCNAVRAKIRRFLESGEMKVGEFQPAIGASSGTYSKFMSQSGPYKGSGSSVYRLTFTFFKLRELNGVKITKKKKVQGTSAEGGKASETTDTSFEGITLEGEEENEVPVYDSCDEIRRKIRQYLARTGMTQAAFAREIAQSFHPEKKISGLAAFIAKKGPAAGNTSSAFYGCYVFFEKMRIKNKNPKTQHRLGMEDAWDGTDIYDLHDRSGPGMNVKKILDRKSYIVGVGQAVYQDESGKPQMRW